MIIQYTLYYASFYYKNNTVAIYHFSTQTLQQIDLDTFIATFQKRFFMQHGTEYNIPINKQRILHLINSNINSCYLKPKNLPYMQFIDNECFPYGEDEILCFK